MNLFEKIAQDFEYLLECFVTMLNNQGEKVIASLLSSGNQHLHDDTAQIEIEKQIQAWSIYHQLMNLVEENAAVQYRRFLSDSRGSESIRGSWEETFKRLQERGLTQDQITQALRKVQVTPVLTAHPTEAKRISILELHRDLYLKLVRLENSTYSKKERQMVREEIIGILERWWRTGEVYLEKPTVTAERNNVLHYFTKVFPKMLRESDLVLRQSWQDAGLDVHLLNKAENYPKLHFGSWVGGDRDGHPYVSAAITKDTLQAHRQGAIKLMIQLISDLGAKMTFSNKRNSFPQFLSEKLHATAQKLGPEGQNALTRNPYEPYRQYANLMLLKLENTLKGKESDSSKIYVDHQPLKEDLAFMRETLDAFGADGIVTQYVLPIERHLDCFGLHLAKLDIRQNSAFHDKVMDQIFSFVNPELIPFSQMPESERCDLLLHELDSKRPFGTQNTRFGEEADSLLQYYRVIADHVLQFGDAGIGSFIVSMTRQVSDLLVVHLFLREVGLEASKYRVVPLFETIEDLESSSEVMRKYLKLPYIQALGITRQEIMLGYSDSNKDGGILASRFSIYQCEQVLSIVASEFGIEFEFFHGIGGTISRGGGKYHRFLESMPSKSLSGAIKLTIQGETIAQQFGNLLNGVYNFEMLSSGTLLQTASYLYPQIKEEYSLEPLTHLKNYAFNAYRNLVENPNFVSFYSSATPIDVLEISKIGSRPARRTGQRTIHDLRAIPWVFSWSQSRFNITGWYGIGTGLFNLRKEHPTLYTSLKNQMESSPLLKYLIIQTETNLLNADPHWMEAYSQLVSDEHIRTTIFDQINQEYNTSLQEIELLFEKSRETRRISQLDNMNRRRVALDALHRLQVAQISLWRSHPETNQKDELAQQLLEITTALANGLKHTG